MKLTFAVTVYNRYDLLLESFSGIIGDPRIDEILVMDDCSDSTYWNKIQNLPKLNPKIKVVRQVQNRGMSENKRDAVFNSKNDWVILADSDNVFDERYLDALESVKSFIPEVIFCPSFASPHFDYRKYQGNSYLKSSSFELLLQETEFSCLMNTCNYVVNREAYLSVWKENKEMIASDTIWFNYLWLKAGNAFFVVPGMEYHHRVHPGSGFLKEIEYNMKKSEEVKKLILEL